MSASLTWLGHSCVAIRLDDLLIVTDPVLRRRIMHLRRERAVDAALLHGAGAVLVSHLHFDHLDLPSLDVVDIETQIVVPAGGGGLLRRRGFRFVREVVDGDEVDLGAVRVRVTHAEHAPSRRLGTARTHPVGYLVQGEHAVYFAGDTDLFAGMGHLGKVDVALLPVSGWGSSTPAGHLDPVRAAQALERIKPRLAVPIHWGTYGTWKPRSDERPAWEFAEIAATLTPDVDVRVLRPGQSCPLD